MKQATCKNPSMLPSNGLLLRNPLTQAYTAPNYQSKPMLYSRNVRKDLPSYYTEVLEDGSTPRNLSFYTRHNPHPVRVKHLKGLLDNPVCMVEDNLERRILWSAPSGEELGLITYRPHGNTRYSANRTKHIPAVGIVPVTYAWKDELEKKAYNAISKALGQNPVPSEQQKACNAATSVGDIKEDTVMMDDDQLLHLLCKILQTDSIPVCQAWLQTASDTEKTIVLNMLRMAATGEFDQLMHKSYHKSTSRPTTAQSEYLWNPQHSATGNHHSHHGRNNKYEQDDKDSINGEQPFKMPVHDTIIRSAQSRLSTGERKPDFHERLQQELDQVELSRRQQQSRGSSRGSSRGWLGRPISAGLMPNHRSSHRIGTSRNRPRSRSATSRGTNSLLPPIVQVNGNNK